MAILKTNPAIAKKASVILKDKRRERNAKSLAGSALSQSKSSKTTSASAARSAAKTLANPNSSKSAKTIAASVLSQKNKKPFPVKTYKVTGSSLTQKASASAVRKVAKKMAK